MTLVLSRLFTNRHPLLKNAFPPFQIPFSHAKPPPRSIPLLLTANVKLLLSLIIPLNAWYPLSPQRERVQTEFARGNN